MCKNCKEDYIGETVRTLETRLKGHVTRNSSAIYEHCDNTGHKIKSENVKILTSESEIVLSPGMAGYFSHLVIFEY